MRTIPIFLSAEYAKSSQTTCVCLLITRKDGESVRFTSVDTSVVVGDSGGVTTDSGIVLDGIYAPVNGLDVKNLVSSSALSVDNTEGSLLADSSAADQEFVLEIITGKWDQASFVLFECNPLDGSEAFVLKRGWTGEAQPSLNTGLHTLEFRSLKQALQQPIGKVVTKTCPYELGLDNGYTSHCPVVLADFTEACEVTVVTSRYVFTIDTAMPDDWSGDGFVEFLTGENAGYRYKVKTLVAGVVTLALPAHFAIEVGDTLDHVAGCRKRFEEDCKTKFDAALDFGGEPHVPGQDKITAAADVSA